MSCHFVRVWASMFRTAKVVFQCRAVRVRCIGRVWLSVIFTLLVWYRYSSTRTVSWWGLAAFNEWFFLNNKRIFVWVDG